MHRRPSRSGARLSSRLPARGVATFRQQLADQVAPRCQPREHALSRKRGLATARQPEAIILECDEQLITDLEARCPSHVGGQDESPAVTKTYHDTSGVGRIEVVGHGGHHITAGSGGAPIVP